MGKGEVFFPNIEAIKSDLLLELVFGKISLRNGILKAKILRIRCLRKSCFKLVINFALHINMAFQNQF